MRAFGEGNRGAAGCSASRRTGGPSVIIMVAGPGRQWSGVLLTTRGVRLGQRVAAVVQKLLAAHASLYLVEDLIEMRTNRNKENVISRSAAHFAWYGS